MRAKLKCMIKKTQSFSINNDELKSPKFCPKNKFEESTNMQCVRKLEIERKEKQQLKLANFFTDMK